MGPAWEPKEGPRERFIRVRAKHSLDIKKSYPSRLGACKCISVVVSPKQGNKYGTYFICLYYAVGKDLEGKALWVRERYHSSPPQGNKTVTQIRGFFPSVKSEGRGKFLAIRRVVKIHLGVQTSSNYLGGLADSLFVYRYVYFCLNHH